MPIFKGLYSYWSPKRWGSVSRVSTGELERSEDLRGNRQKRVWSWRTTGLGQVIRNTETMKVNTCKAMAD